VVVTPRQLISGGALLLLASSSCSAPLGRSPDSAAAESRRRRTITLDAPAPCVAPGAETCFNGIDDNCNGLIDEGCGIPSSPVMFAVAWDDRAADIDLLVTDPNNELIEVGRIARSGLTKDRDCPGKRDNSCSANLETVYLTDKTPVSGPYQVTVRLERLGNDAPPVAADLGVLLGELSTSRTIALRYPEDERRYSFELPWPKSSAASPSR
jgi:hypothetical protein